MSMLYNILPLFLHYSFTFTVWSPALRTGKGWNEYLVFDFGVITRLNRVRVERPPDTPEKTFRGLSKVKIGMLEIDFKLLPTRWESPTG